MQENMCLYFQELSLFYFKIQKFAFFLNQNLISALGFNITNPIIVQKFLLLQ